MSADAKVWQEDDGGWNAIHDGECGPSSCGFSSHDVTEFDLSYLLKDIERVMGCTGGMRWTLYVYPDGKAGLRGFRC